MTAIDMPYDHSGIRIRIPSERLLGVLESHASQFTPPAGEEELIRRALENPIASPRLRDLARDRRRIVIIVSDHTRPVPTKLIAPQLLAEIHEGNPEAEVTFLVATGFHRAITAKELSEKFGAEQLGRAKVVVHNAKDQASLVHAGKLPSGGTLSINRLAMEADLLLAEGFIEPHLFAGFSGGRKSVLPGIVGEATVLANRCAEFVTHPNARPGILKGNPLHADMVYAARRARLAFILNVVLNADKRVIAAFAGDAEKAHLQGCRFVSELVQVDAKRADIVVTSNGGYPLDQNVYQHVKALTSAEATCNEGGVIIVTAACGDGHGSEDMYNWLRRGARTAMGSVMRADRSSALADQWATQIMARIQMKHPIIFVTDQCDHRILNEMGFCTARTFDEALSAAEAIVGANASITVVPDGASVIVN